jgi:queuosine precursor transporter
LNPAPQLTLTDRPVFRLDRPQKLLLVSTAIFLTALVVAEATGSKFFTLLRLPFAITIFGVRFTEVTMTAGVIAFPVTFIFTDLLNDLYGKRVIRFVTLVGMAMIIFEFFILQISIKAPTSTISPVPDEAFAQVFGAAGRIIFGSLIAYVVSQFVDIYLFYRLRNLTHGRYLWVRATGSTFGSQFIDTFIVLTIAFSGQLKIQEIIAITLFNYLYKFVIAILITPLIYIAHWLMERYLGKETVHAMQLENHG